MSADEPHLKDIARAQLAEIASRAIDARARLRNAWTEHQQRFGHEEDPIVLEAVRRAGIDDQETEGVAR